MEMIGEHIARHNLGVKSGQLGILDEWINGADVGEYLVRMLIHLCSMLGASYHHRISLQYNLQQRIFLFTC